MRCFLVVILLLCWSASSLSAEDKPADYCKVELRGTLDFGPDKHELFATQGIEFSATAAGKNLIFGENKELAAQAKKLDGKRVLIHGHLGVWSPVTAGPPKEFVSYIRVTAIQAADQTDKPQDAEQTADATAKEAVELVKGLTVKATITNTIGNFGSPGRPEAGDSFELAFDDLPQEMLKFTTPNAQTHYIPFRGPLQVVHVTRQGEKVKGPRRAAIHLSASDANHKLLIQVVAESLEKGSKVRVYTYRDIGFLGSMAEGEGELK